MNKNVAVIRENLVASIGVFIVAIPLSVGIALASGASAASGMVAAVIGGILVGSLAGAPLVVSGPAAGLAALSFQIVQTHGIVGLAGITVLGGIFQILFGLVRSGTLFTKVPLGVLKGMLAAIGLLILAGQLHVIAGGKVPSGFIAGLAALPSSFGTVVAQNSINSWAVVICGLVGVSIQVVWPMLSPRLQWIPGALPAVLVVTAASLLWEMPRVVSAPIFGHMAEGMSSILGAATRHNILIWLPAAIGLAVVASAETLLTARAVDALALAKRGSSAPKPALLNRELFAQGAGNLVSGFFGGLPITGVIVRSAANVSFGARDRSSAILHGCWILLFVAAMPHVLELVPLTVLASVLVVTGWKLFDPRQLRALWRSSKVEGASWLVTCISIVMTNLLTGLGIGLAFALLVRAPMWVLNFRNSKERELSPAR